MATVTLNMPMTWNNSLQDISKSLVFSVSEFKEQFLWGIPLCNPVTGQKITDDTIKQKLLASQKFLEEYIGVKLFKQVVEESKDYVREEYFQWGFIKTSWQINEPISLIGCLNNQQQINYPKEWLTTKKSSENLQLKYTQLYIVPNGQNNATTQFLAVNYSQYFSFYGARIIPNYWKVRYCTGYDQIPQDLIETIGMMATVSILPIIEMTIGGVGGHMFGLASQSLSMDGLSQSVSKANGGNIFGQRIKLYGDQLLKKLAQLRSIYGGIKFDVM